MVIVAMRMLLLLSLIHIIFMMHGHTQYDYDLTHSALVVHGIHTHEDKDPVVSMLALLLNLLVILIKRTIPLIILLTLIITIIFILMIIIILSAPYYTSTITISS
jgi:hypothetical protein